MDINWVLITKYEYCHNLITKDNEFRVKLKGGVLMNENWTQLFIKTKENE